MGRSKVMGKPVADLTPAELKSELHRCKTLAEVYGNTVAAKELRKRALKIERRIAEPEDS